MGIEYKRVFHYFLTGHLAGMDMDIIAETALMIQNEPRILEFKGCGITLHIPQNSLPSYCQQCELKIVASLSSTFELPPNCELVSGMYWIQCPVELTKDVTLEVQHCSTQTEKLTFVRAGHTETSFEAIKGGEFPKGSTHGSIKLSAFSLYAIVQWLFPGWFSSNRRYEATVYRSLTPIKNTWTLFFTIIQNLDLEEMVGVKFVCVYEKDSEV